MNIRTRSLNNVFRLGIAIVFATLALTGRARADDPEFVPRQALVRLVAGVTPESFRNHYNLVLLESIPERNIHLFQLPETFNEPAYVELFDADSMVVFADLNFFADDTNPDGTTQDIFLARSLQAYQSDPTPRLIGSPIANLAARGTGVVVAVIDTGLDSSHPHFSGRIAPGGYNFIEENSNFADAGTGLFNGHGTIVAGVIVRVAPEVKILPLRVLDPAGDTTTFLLARAIYYAIDHGATIINISLGTKADPDLLRDAVNEAATRGVLIIAAAGNDDAQSPARSPAGLSELGVVAVAALDQNFVKAPFSNYGSWLSIAAPGVDVHGPIPGGGYGSASGTSFSAPLVSGVAALIRSSCPSMTLPIVRGHLLAGSLSIEQLNPSYSGQLGLGGLHAVSSVALALHSTPRCRCAADFDGSGTSTLQDLFTFLTAWFDSNMLADVDSSGTIGIQDIIDFVGYYFDGCN